MKSVGNSGFRYDINGLRAWAVVAIILYHFEVSGFSGGFIGVDVFFVISGFLMAGILVRGAERMDRGSRAPMQFLLEFWLARARRIIPALAVVCAVVLVWGWYTLVPEEFVQQARQAYRAIQFRSNAGFANEAGYFDDGAHQKFLLHTWSLAVECQFYLIFPLVVLGIGWLKAGRGFLFFLLGTLAAASFFYGVFQTHSEPSQAFFRLSSRAWELLAGALAYLAGDIGMRSERRARLLELGGFVLIVAAIAFMDARTPWP
jgi:peptidoglycan/LPS O-acetylase OafA/YrhL